MRMRNLLLSEPVLRSRFYCTYCDIDLLSHQRLFESMVFDHLVPRSHGGSDGPNNLQLVCAACDRCKRNQLTATIEEARALLVKIRIGKTQYFNRYRDAFRAAELSALAGIGGGR